MSGEFADYALDEMMDVVDEQQRWAGVDPLEMPEHVRESLYNYDGSMIPFVFSHQPHFRSKPSGPGACPKCGGPTTIKTNRQLNIPFYGCCDWPNCNGSRNHDGK